MRKLLIVDVEEQGTDYSKATPQQLLRAKAAAEQIRFLSGLTGEAFVQYGQNLDTIAKARAWLIDSRNWHSGQMFILKWDSLRPTVCQTYGEKLTHEWWDDGLPECVIMGQHRIREGRKEPEVENMVE